MMVRVSFGVYLAARINIYTFYVFLYVIKLIR